MRKLPLQTTVLMALVTLASSAAAQGAPNAGRTDPYRADPYTVGGYCYRPSFCYEQGASSHNWTNPDVKRERQVVNSFNGVPVDTRTTLIAFGEYEALAFIGWELTSKQGVDGVPKERLHKEAALIFTDLRERDNSATLEDLIVALQPAVLVALEQRAAFFASAISEPVETEVLARIKTLDSDRARKLHDQLLDVLNRAWHKAPDAPPGSADSAVRKALKLG